MKTKSTLTLIFQRPTILGGRGTTTLPGWREDGCLILAVTENGHLAILLSFRAMPSFDANIAARVRAPSAGVCTPCGSKMHPMPLTMPFPSMTTAPSSDAALHTSRGESLHNGRPTNAASTAPRLARIFLPVMNKTFDHLFRGRHDQ